MRVGLVAGEASGDLLAAGLIREIRARVPDAVFEGIAGPALAGEGCDTWATADTLAVMGLVEPLAHIPRLLRLRRAIARRWRDNPPDVFVGIDAPDFNLGLEIKLRRFGIRTAHYVSPSIWAWRPRRVHKVAKAADRVLCILPFEKPIYDAHGIDAVFVGHPKADLLAGGDDRVAARTELSVTATEVVAVLPGSRMGEVSRLGDTLAGAAKLLADRRPELRFLTPVASPRLRSLIEGQLAAAGVADRFDLIAGRSERVMAAADVVLLASGTAALESALLGKPTVAAYRVSPMTYAIARGLKLVKLTHYTLPNLLTESPLVPEFIQGAATPEALAEAVAALLDDPARRELISRRFATLRSELALNADQRAAESVIDLARR